MPCRNAVDNWYRANDALKDLELAMRKAQVENERIREGMQHKEIPYGL